MTKPKKKAKEDCTHDEAFVIAYFHDVDHDCAYLVFECPDCGEELVLPGSLVEHMGQD